MKRIMLKLDKLDMLLLAMFLSLFFWFIAVMVGKINSHKSDMKEICKIEINGKIAILEYKSRGDYFVKIETKDTAYEIHGIQINWYVMEYKIKVGDSVSKSYNSNIMTFHKVVNGKYKEVVKYQIPN